MFLMCAESAGENVKILDGINGLILLMLSCSFTRGRAREDLLCTFFLTI